MVYGGKADNLRKLMERWAIVVVGVSRKDNLQQGIIGFYHQ